MHPPTDPGNQSGYAWSYEEMEDWLCYMTEDEWDDLWDWLESLLSDDEYDLVCDMYWDEFIDFLCYIFS